MPYRPRKNERLNPYLNSFLSNLRKNYGLKNYIWTRENTKGGRAHFHLLADIPFIPIKKINDAWASAVGSYSPNCVRLPKDSKAIVNDLEKSVKYISKYITKDQNEKFSERCYSISKDINQKPIRISYADFRTIDFDHKKDLKYRVYDHCTTVKIWDFFKKADYFISFLGNIAENDETLNCQGETVKTIESHERPAGIKPAVQISLFDP